MKRLDARTIVLPFLVLASALALAAPHARGQSSVTATLSPRQAEASPISELSSGLSYESGQLTRSFTRGGRRVFRLSAENADLVGILRSLGVRSLRIGGNSSDGLRFVPGRRGNSTTGSMLFADDLDRLFAFAEAAGVDVILSVPLRNYDPDNAALMAAYARANDRGRLAAIAIGNEPDLYVRNGYRPATYSYAAYRAEVDVLKARILAMVPGMPFCGPNTAGSPSWAENFARDRVASIITRHNYPGGDGQAVTNPASARDRLLRLDYQGAYNQWAPAALAAGLPFRLEETNSYYGGGAPNVSNGFAAALWGLDYLHWWASRRAQGLNFHTGDTSGGYSAITAVAEQYTVRPLGYGIKAFDLGGHGRTVPSALDNPDRLNLTAYGVLGADRSLYVTAINKTNGAGARDAVVTLNVLGWYSSGQAIYLEAPNRDVGALSGITLGGAEIAADGGWPGTPVPLPPPALGRFTLRLPAATAVVVKLSP